MFIQYVGTLEEAMCLCAENHLLQWLLVFLHLSFPNLLYRSCQFSTIPKYFVCMLVLANAAQDFTLSCFWILFLDILYDPLDEDWPITVELPVLHTDTKRMHISRLWEGFRLTITIFKRLDHVTVWSVILSFSHYRCNTSTGYVTEIYLMYLL
jgi:hypothetical protein